MAARKSAGTDEAATEGAVNEVRLVGRLAAEAEARELPSGDRLMTFRLVVDRPGGGASRQKVDALECAAWSARVRRSAATWRPGDTVEVSGSIRRRFFRTPVGAASRVEVEVATGRLIRRAATA